ncbi:MAG: GGDEF domain-containing protein [Lachnospiraceae bacterium]|nr:GGDEF domain-containing protein [Lachnospiraceae bacterium]
MEKALLGDKLTAFLELLQKPVSSEEELAKNVRMALECIAGQMKIGKVEVCRFAPDSRLRAQIDRHTVVLYQSDALVGDDALELTYRSDDGGAATLSYYPVKNYRWEEEEQRELLLLGNLILWAFRLIIMGDLLKRTATMDLAGGIPNTAGFIGRLAGVIAQGRIEHYTGFYLNTHNFKYVNKVLPHQNADEVMWLYIRQLLSGIEEDECVARLGGDNFVALIRNENADAFIRWVSDINVRYKGDSEEKVFNFGATIGAAQLKEIRNPGEIMLRISSAYQAARQKEGNDVVYYNEELYKEMMRQKEVIGEFHRGIKKQEFVVYYQPKVNTQNKQLCGAEALVRWRKPDESLVPPMAFIPILEKDGSICLLDFYVLDKVCAFLNRCIREHKPLYKISVNFSKRHVENPHLVNEIVNVLDSHRVPHELIEIELTESEDAKDYIVMSNLIDKLKAEGISVSVDDFGTGYSSMNMLKMIHTDILKVDKSLIPFGRFNSDNQKDCIMFESIVSLAKALGFQVVAEGVETLRQYEYMRDAGCDIIQGYYFDKPLPVDEYLNRLLFGQYS